MFVRSAHAGNHVIPGYLDETNQLCSRSLAYSVQLRIGETLKSEE